MAKQEDGSQIQKAPTPPNVVVSRRKVLGSFRIHGYAAGHALMISAITLGAAWTGCEISKDFNRPPTK